MSDTINLTDRILSRRAAVPADEDPDASEDCGAFGFLRGARDRAVMLDFRFLTGNRVAFPYAFLERVSYDPSDGVELRFLGVVVTLRGRNLSRATAAGVSLVDALHRHRVAWVGEVEEFRGAFTADDTVVVTRIEITPPR